MKNVLTVVCLLAPAVAFAQQPEVIIKVTPAELNIIGQGLDGQTQAIQTLTAKLRQQFIDQQPKPVAVPSEQPKKDE